MPDVTVRNDGTYPALNLNIVGQSPSFTANTTVTQVTVENTGEYPTLKLVTSNQYPNITILTPQPIILGGGGGGSSVAGANGAQGIQGVQGIQGPAGNGNGNGSQGTQGIQGVQGIQGIQGTQGIQGIQGVQGIRGNTGSIKIDEPLFDSGTGLVKSSSFTTGTVGTARKLVFLAQDGSLTFDYIRNYDVFNPADLTFAISSFTTSISSNNLIGSGNFSLNGKSANVTYTAASVPTGLTLSMSTGLNFPITVSSPYTSYTFTSSNSVPYTTAPQSVTLTATARDATATTSSASVTFNFINNIYYGKSSLTSFTLSASVTSLTSVLQNSKTYTFSIAAGSGEYVYYAYPSRLGTATFTVGGFAGGFNSPSTLSVTNSNGYSENYYIYRSTNPNLGSITVVVT